MPGYQVSNLRIILAAKTRKKNSFSTLSLCPFLGEHLSHLANVHLPVVLLVHHNLIDNHLLPNGPTCIFAKMIKAPTFPATPASPYRPPLRPLRLQWHLLVNLLPHRHHHLNDDHQFQIALSHRSPDFRSWTLDPSHPKS